MKRFHFEFKLFWANRLNRCLLLAYFIAAMAAIVMGNHAYQHELKLYAIAEADYQQTLLDYRDQYDAGEFKPGYMGYYLFHPVAQTPPVWTSLFRGERDESANHLRVRLLGLQTQLNASDPVNADSLLSGQFDLAFIWIYLMPLLIAAMGVNVLADEKSSGRWPMLLSQVSRGRAVIFHKLSLPALLLSALNLLIVLFAVLMTDLQLNWQLAGVAGLVLLYQFCWWLICSWLVTLNRSASFNYLSFLSIWLLFSFVIPGVSYLYQVQQQTPGADAAIVFEQRQYMNDSWDRDKHADFAAFLDRFPAWKDTATLGEEFDWRWYYAMQHMSDVVVADHVQQRIESKQASYQQGLMFSWLSPVMGLQYGLNRLADADTLAQLSFQQQVSDYHAELETFLWSFLFFNKPFEKTDFEQIPAFTYELYAEGLAVTVSFKLVLLSLLFSTLIAWRLRRLKL
jgi:ABC-2 type transport system permease protein